METKMAEKREAKSTVSTKEGMLEVRVIVDFTAEDLVEHIAKTAAAEIALNSVYENLPDRCVLNRDLKNLLVVRSN